MNNNSKKKNKTGFEREFIQEKSGITGEIRSASQKL